MSRGYRGRRSALVALLFWSALVAVSPPKADDAQQQHAPGQHENRPVEVVTPTIYESLDPPELNQPCYDGENKRASQLCAQWKAADAASEAVTAAWVFGSIGSVIGSLTLLAAIAAALYARKAADEAKRGADETQASNAAFLSRERGWLNLKGCRLIADAQNPRVKLMLANTGNARCDVDGMFWSEAEDAAALEIDEEPSVFTPVKIEAGDGGGAYIPLGVTKQVYLLGYVRYRTLTMGDRRTHFHISVENSGGWRAREVVPSFGKPEDT